MTPTHLLRSDVRRTGFALAALAAAGLALSSCGPRDDRQPTNAAKEAEETAKKAASAYPKVLLIGLDGTTWEVLDPLLKAGRLPTFQKLMEEGTRADLTSIYPFKSPMIWTTVATGWDWTHHGIFDFDLDGKPVSSNMRKKKALWNILTEEQKSVGVIGYWVTWPAEEVNGYVVTERAYFGGVMDKQTYPADILAGYGDFWAWKPESPENFEKMKRFFNGFEFDQAYYADIKKDQKRIDELLEAYKVKPDENTRFMNHFLVDNRLSFFFPKDESIARLTPWLMKKRPTDLTMTYLQGIDVVSHGFWKFYRPGAFRVSDVEKWNLGEIIPRYCEYIDSKIAEILANVDDKTVVIICSDHGFEDWVADMKTETYWYLSGNHKANGIFLMKGPHVKKGVRLKDAHVLDIAPTILYLMGLQVASDMEGRVLTSALETPFLTQNPIFYVPTYEDDGPRGDATPMASPVDEQEMERLRALGYIQPKKADNKKKDGD